MFEHTNTIDDTIMIWLEMLPVPVTEHFLWNFFLLLLNQSFICRGSQFSALFNILQEHMSL